MTWALAGLLVVLLALLLWPKQAPRCPDCGAPGKTVALVPGYDGAASWCRFTCSGPIAHTWEGWR